MRGLRLAEALTAVLQDRNQFHSVLVGRPLLPAIGPLQPVCARHVPVARVYAIVRQHAGQVWLFVGVKGFADAWKTTADPHLVVMMDVAGKTHAWTFRVPHPDSPSSVCAAMASTTDPTLAPVCRALPASFRLRLSTAVTPGTPTPSEAQFHIMRRHIDRMISLQAHPRTATVAGASVPISMPNPTRPALRRPPSTRSPSQKRKPAKRTTTSNEDQPERTSAVSSHARISTVGNAAHALGHALRIGGHTLRFVPSGRYVVTITDSASGGFSARIRESLPEPQEEGAASMRTRAAKRRRK